MWSRWPWSTPDFHRHRWWRDRRCGEGPNLFVRELEEGDDPHGEPEVRQLLNQRSFYPGVDERVCDRVLDEHCGQGRPIAELVDEY